MLRRNTKSQPLPRNMITPTVKYGGTAATIVESPKMAKTSSASKNEHVDFLNHHFNIVALTREQSHATMTKPDQFIKNTIILINQLAETVEEKLM